MLGFSLGVYPVIVKDTEFYLDSEKVLLNRNTSIIKNQINEFKLINLIKKTKNLIITFKEKVGKNVYYPSLLIDKLGINKRKCVLGNVRYSHKSTEFEVAKYYDLNRLPRPCGHLPLRIRFRAVCHPRRRIRRTGDPHRRGIPRHARLFR